MLILYNIIQDYKGYHIILFSATSLYYSTRSNPETTLLLKFCSFSRISEFGHYRNLISEIEVVLSRRYLRSGVFAKIILSEILESCERRGSMFLIPQEAQVGKVSNYSQPDGLTRLFFVEKIN